MKGALLILIPTDEFQGRRVFFYHLTIQPSTATAIRSKTHSSPLELPSLLHHHPFNVDHRGVSQVRSSAEAIPVVSQVR